MNEQMNQDVMSMLLRQMPKPSIPAELIAAIESKTSRKRSWWNTDGVRTQWLPAMVALATACAALLLSKIQARPNPRAVIPIAAEPRAREEFSITHAEISPSPDQSVGRRRG